MELNDAFNNGAFSNLEKPEKTANTPEIDSMQKVGKEKINSLKKFIQEIEDLIGEREFLSEQISKEVEKIKNEIQNFLLTTKAIDSEGFKERNGLRQKQVEISELQLNEKVNCWRDVALLKKELRERERELTEKEERMSLLDQILE